MKEPETSIALTAICAMVLLFSMWMIQLWSCGVDDRHGRSLDRIEKTLNEVRYDVRRCQ